MKKPDTDKMSLRMEHIWLEAENRIIEDIVRRIKKAGKITSTADYQINRLVEMGKSTEEVERILKEALNATYPEMFKLYDDIAEWQYARDKCLFEGGIDVEIKEFDTVLLKDGRKADIMEVLDDKTFIADVGNPPADWETVDITIDDIEKVI